MRISQEEINKISDLVADLTMASTDRKIVDEGGQVQDILLSIEQENKPIIDKDTLFITWWEEDGQYYPLNNLELARGAWNSAYEAI